MKSTGFPRHSDTSSVKTDFEGLDFAFASDHAILVHVAPRLKGRIEIPRLVNGLNVKAVNGFAFARASVESVSLPDTLELLGSYAFLECHNLHDVHIEASALETVGADPFAGCKALRELRVSGRLSFGALMLSLAHHNVRYIYEDGNGRIGDYRLTVQAISE